jgi:predicted transcriptional regulator
MTKSEQILAAVREGAQTSREIAQRVRQARSTVSVSLARLEDLGAVERRGVAIEGLPGRPCLRWRLATHSSN